MKIRIKKYLVEDGRQLRGKEVDFPAKRAQQLIEAGIGEEIESAAPVAEPTPTEATEEAVSADASATTRRRGGS